MKIDRRDILFLFGLVVVLALYILSEFDFSCRPLEDAAILLRYSKNVADGHGVVWNIGESPVEGATDFLFMILLAGLHTTGLTLEAAAVSVGLLSHLILAIVVYAGIRWTQGLHRFYAMISSAFIAFGPGLAYVQAQFGTTFFAVFAGVTFLAALSCIKNPNRLSRSFLFALSSLMLGLIRPDGVLLCLAMLAGLLYTVGWRPSLLILKYYIPLFVLPGLVYLFWRWEYFGYFLPNPMYRKGDLWPGNMTMSVSNTLAITFPFYIVFVYWIGEFTTLLFLRLNSYDIKQALRRGSVIVFVVGVTGLFRTSSPANEFLILDRYSPLYSFVLLLLFGAAVIAFLTSKKISHNPHLAEQMENRVPFNVLSSALVLPLVSIATFVIGWSFMSHEMDFVKRYEYAVVPIVMMSWPKLAALLVDRISPSQIGVPILWLRVSSILATAILLITIILYQRAEYSPRMFVNVDIGGRYNTAMQLQAFREKGYTIAGSEAGILPFYSGWVSIDTWGLNNPWVAHHGPVTEGYLANYMPHLIVLYAPVLRKPVGASPSEWAMMVNNLHSFIETQNYELAAVYGVSPHIADHYYVRRDFVDSQAIIEAIRGVDYRWKGQKSFDFSGFAEDR